MDICKDSFVRLEYRLRLDTGEMIKGSEEEPATLTFIAGYGELLPGLEQRLIGLKQNDRREFIIPAAEAFGPYEPKQVQKFNKKYFPPEADFRAGQKVIPASSLLPLDYPFIVKEVKENYLVLDMNHPLAGKDLYYTVQILEVRPATPEELEPLEKCQSCQEELVIG
jgi:FKBP-type peptidyl-prolyl cis-trans isomerase SlyD